MPVHVVTDSTADLEPAFLLEYGISMVPLTVHLDDGESYLDREELRPGEFAARLPHLRRLPTTSAPSPGAFRAVYLKAFEAGAEGVLSLHLSGRLSGTVQSAEMAARMMDRPVEVLDLGTAGLGTGLLAWWAARRARSGMALEDLSRELRMLETRVFSLLAPVTLEYLARGGRIGQAARMVGTLFDMKPVLSVHQGHVRPLRKVRGERQILPAMGQAFLERVSEGRAILGACSYGGDMEPSHQLKAWLTERYRLKGWLASEMGPVITTHVGPGAIGAIMLELTDDEARWWEEEK